MFAWSSRRRRSAASWRCCCASTAAPGGVRARGHLRATDAVAAEVLDLLHKRPQRLARARHQLRQFLTGRCGLNRPKRPVRCARKTKVSSGRASSIRRAFASPRSTSTDQGRGRCPCPRSARPRGAGLRRVAALAARRQPSDFASVLREVMTGRSAANLGWGTDEGLSCRPHCLRVAGLLVRRSRYSSRPLPHAARAPRAGRARGCARLDAALAERLLLAFSPRAWARTPASGCSRNGTALLRCRLLHDFAARFVTGLCTQPEVADATTQVPTPAAGELAEMALCGRPWPVPST